MSTISQEKTIDMIIIMKEAQPLDMIRPNMSKITIGMTIRSKGTIMEEQTITEMSNIIINIETKEIITTTMKTEEGIKDSLHTKTEVIEEIKDAIHMRIEIKHTTINNPIIMGRTNMNKGAIIKGRIMRIRIYNIEQ